MARSFSSALVACGLAISCLAFANAEQATKPKTDDQIKQEIIKESISRYSGSCPCPYSKDRAGRSCGKRSAYSKPGGASPLCYPSDVSKQMVDEYRKRQK